MTLCITHATVSADPAVPPHHVCTVDGVVTSISTGLGCEHRGIRIDAAGFALTPGFHDRHIHLLALGAARNSLNLDERSGAEQMMHAIREATRNCIDRAGWVRVIGYNDITHGDLNRELLDRVTGDVPVRVQHRSGAVWIMNSAALNALGLRDTSEGIPSRLLQGDAGPSIDEETGAERFRGTLTGKLWRADQWIRSRIPGAFPDLGEVSRELISLGITQVTDASPALGSLGLTHLKHAVNEGRFRPRVTLLDASLTREEHLPTRIEVGPRKVALEDHALPELATVIAAVHEARECGRGVAFHTVSLDSLVLAMMSLQAVGPHPEDRFEHAAVVPAALMKDIRNLGVSVVTQPGFIAHRGGTLMRDFVDSVGDLYRVRSLVESGIPVWFSSDAPYGPLSPAMNILAAASRLTEHDKPFGLPGAETLPIAEGFSRYLVRPGISVGDPADLIVHDRPYPDLMRSLTSHRVQHTIIQGQLVTL